MFGEAVALLFLLLEADMVQGWCSRDLVPLPSLDGVVGRDPLLDLTTDTRVECAMLCVIHPDCNAFSYHRDYHRCQIHWRPTPVLGDAYPGMQSFQIPGCRKSGSGVRTHHLCTLCLELFTTPLTFDSAVQTCQEEGGSLLKWTRPLELAVFLDFVYSNLSAHSDVWVGASDQVSEGTYLWQDGTPADIPWLTKYGEPLGGDSEDCVFFGHGVYRIKPNMAVLVPAFQVSSCSTLRKFVCSFARSGGLN